MVMMILFVSHAAAQTTPLRGEDKAAGQDQQQQQEVFIADVSKENIYSLSVKTDGVPMAVLVRPSSVALGSEPIHGIFRDVAAFLGGSGDLVFGTTSHERIPETMVRLITGAGLYVDVDNANTLSHRELVERVLSVGFAQVHRFQNASDATEKIHDIVVENKVAMVAVFPSQEIYDECAVWKRISLHYRSLYDLCEVVGGTSNKGDEILDALGISRDALKGPTLYMLSLKDTDKELQGAGELWSIAAHRYRGGICENENALHEFFVQNVPTTTEPLSKDSFQKSALYGVNAVVLFSSPTGSDRDAELQQYRAVAQDRSLRTKFLFFEAEGDKVKEFADLFDVQNFPAIVATRNVMNHFRMPEVPRGAAAAADNRLSALVRGFLSDIETGRIQESTAKIDNTPPKAKSAPPPAQNDGPVLVVTRDTYQELVLDSDKDVFVEFYYPWCMHCKNLAPFWEALGMSFFGIESLVIAKFDMEANKAPEDLQIPGAPSMFFFKANDKANPIAYKGRRDLASLIQFVKASVSVPLPEPKQESHKLEEMSQQLKDLIAAQTLKIKTALQQAEAAHKQKSKEDL